jgi:hypothetical protein
MTEFDSANQHAFEGGDTAPSVAAEIKARNEAMQEHADTLREIEEKRVKANDEAYEAGIKAERAVASSTQALVTGAAVGEQGVEQVEGAGVSEGGEAAVTRKTSKSSS